MKHLSIFLTLATCVIFVHGINVEVGAAGGIQVSENEIATLRLLETKALKVLFESTEGDRWRDRENWGDGDPCGSKKWFGVRCNELQMVDGLKLAANKLNGTIPDVWHDLPQLKILDLSLNYLRGSIPRSLEHLPLLRELDLGYNYLLVPLRIFGGMVQLTFLALHWNTLITGTLRDLSPLKNLASLNLRDNAMESLTLDGIESLTSLRQLDLSKSGLQGELKLSSLNGLIEFKASNNRLSGTITTDDSVNLRSLVTLELSNNLFTGPVPQLSTAVLLEQLDLSQNMFHTSNLVMSEHLFLKSLRLSGNSLESRMPYDLHMLNYLKVLECSNCDLTGVVGLPLGSLSNLERLDLSNNRLVGRLPRAVWQMTELEHLDVSNNNFEGEIHSSIGKMSNLRILRLAFNQLTGVIPTHIGHCQELQEIRLEHNQFHGALPNVFSLFQGGTIFAIHHNRLTSLPMNLPRHVQVWPMRESDRPASAVTESLIITLVVYHNDLPLQEVHQEEGDENSVAVTVAVSNNDVKMFRVCGTMNDFYQNTLVRAGWLRTETDRYHASYGLCYEESSLKDPKRVLSIQRVSRFPDVGQMSDKGHLTHNIEIMRRSFPKEYSFYPTSFTIPSQLAEFKTEFDTVQATLRNGVENLWLMKPRARCCGEGIRIISNATQSAELVDPDLGEWYVQKFVSPPAMIDGHKFVFRLFAVVTR